LWGGEGERLGSGRKRHLAPGGETMVGLEAFEPVREIIWEVAGYVPDLLPGEGTSVLELTGTGAERWRFGATVCFDNAFPDSYAAPLRREPVDFHLVVSNEAWYRGAQELDQMIAFSRLHALCTGRSLVRCANSGISAAFGADGGELARLRVGARDREVRGTLAVDVPVPEAGAQAARTPYVWLEPGLLPTFALLALALALAPRRRGILPGELS
jgi:apolipoprotein N-acyltransferase